MKKTLFIGALVAAMMVAAACGKKAQPAPQSALEVIKARTSVRSFTGEKLSEEQINTLLDAAMAAPTAANEQPWRFIVITDEEVKAGLYSGEVHKKMVVTAGAVIVVCGENTRLRRPHGAAPDAEPSGNRIHTGTKTVRPPRRICCWLPRPWTWVPSGFPAIRSSAP